MRNQDCLHTFIPYGLIFLLESLPVANTALDKVMHYLYDIGTVCRGKKFKNWPEYNGMECVIIEPPMLTIGHDSRGTSTEATEEICYGVHWNNGDRNYVPPRRLEPKKTSVTPITQTLTIDL
jgi:hypothetical protein